MVKNERTITPLKSYALRITGDVICAEFADAELIIELLIEDAEKKNTIKKLQKELSDANSTNKQGHINYCELEKKYNTVLKALRLSPNAGEATIKQRIQEVIDTYANSRQN